MGKERGTFVLAVVAAVSTSLVLLPIGVNAAGEAVSIKDADSPLKAQVANGGKLKIGDGAGPLSVDGTVTANLPGTVNVAGEVDVTSVKNDVTTTPDFGSFTQYFALTSNTDTVESFYGPFGISQRVAWNSMTFINRGTEPAEIRIRHSNPTTGACPSGAGEPTVLIQEVAMAMIPGKDTVHLDFPTPIRMDIDNNDDYCVVAVQTGGNGEVVSTLRGINYSPPNNT